MMRFLLLLFCGLWLLPQAAFAQITVSGRVVDAKSGDGLPGVTVLQTGTANGVSSDASGRFSLTMPSAADSIALTFCYIGYITKQLRVSASGIHSIRLMPDERAFVADAGVLHYPYLGVGLIGGIRYAPFGARLLLDGRRSLHLPIAVTGSYQTNFSRNHYLSVRLELPPLHEYGRVTINEDIDYQQLQAVAANLRFVSYTATAKLQVYRIGQLRMPALSLGAGYCQNQKLNTDASPAYGYGYRLGMQLQLLSYPLQLFTTTQATHWPGFWQWQGQITHPFAKYFQAGIEGNYLREYAEISLTVSRYFYKGI